jgi:hypothetical protein
MHNYFNMWLHVIQCEIEPTSKIQQMRPFRVNSSEFVQFFTETLEQ